MDTNVKCIEPNLAIFFRDYELKHYNLVWGNWQYDDNTPSYITYITNALLQRTAEGEIIPPSYPTDVEMQTQVTSLDYDGEYFWSVQAMNNTPYYPGWIVSKWIVNEDFYGLQRLQFKSFPGFNSAGCLAIEWYKTTLYQGTDADRSYIRLAITDKNTQLFKRVQPGFKIKVGPNTTENPTSFWGTVKDAYWVPDTPYHKPYPPYPPGSTQLPAFYYQIDFEENLNATYVAGQEVFFEAGLFVFAGEKVKRLHPESLSVIEEWSGNEFSNVSACAFTIVNNVPNIYVGQRSPVLFYVRDMVVYCRRIEDFDHIVSAQVLEKQHERYGNSFIDVYELRVRNDHPDEITNYPQHYLLQKEYRDSRNVDAGTSEWSTYNYILQKLHGQATSMVVDVSPQHIAQSGIAFCKCQILDDYDFPVPGVEVTWSHNCGGDAEFLDTTTSGTDLNGYVYNRLYIKDQLSFPAYITATTDEL